MNRQQVIGLTVGTLLFVGAGAWQWRTSHVSPVGAQTGAAGHLGNASGNSVAPADVPANSASQDGNANRQPTSTYGALTDREVVMAVNAAVRGLVSGRSDIFFDELQTTKVFRQGGPRWVAALRSELENTEAVEALPVGVIYTESRPQVVVQRMAMIDLLDELAKDDPTALHSMFELAEQPIDSGLPDHVKRVLIGERYDLLFRLVQHDQEGAFALFGSYPGGQQKTLLPALVGGLEEAHVSNEAAQRLLSRLHS